MTSSDPTPLFAAEPDPPAPPAQKVADAFDPARLTQARHKVGWTKKELATRLGVTPAAVGQYEAGSARPRPGLVAGMAEQLGMPVHFFAAGRPHAQLDPSRAHFRSLRSTRAYERDRAVAFTEQVWELTLALERRVKLPDVDLPGWEGGEAVPEDFPTDPPAAARALRQRWNLGHGPVAHLVRLLESRGLVVALLPFSDSARVDAFSTSRLPRPVVVLTDDRDDVYRQRFTSAHELGHLVMHTEVLPGDTQQEREADAFAAEFLMPTARIGPALPALPARADFAALAQLQRTWGVSVDALLYRCRELGLLSDAAAARAWRRLGGLRSAGSFPPEPTGGYPGERPELLTRAYELAAARHGLTLGELAHELAWPVTLVRQLLNQPDPRPPLRVVTH